ncbi:MAG: glycosyltransferase [Bacteroidales bacterium]|nr:glycosyltransferase [Bacteroidales bacterium]
MATTKTIVFSDIILGHYLEYVHHIYMGALEHKDEEFIFVVPEQFLEHKSKYEWPKADNISIEYLSADECQYCLPPSPLKAAWRKSKLIRTKCKKHKADRVILTNLSAAIPFLPFFLPYGVKAQGVQYRIYRYGNLSGIRLFLEKVRYQIMARHSQIASVMILNDQESADYFNKVYHTHKFKFLSDPVPEVDESQLEDLREDLGIPKENKIFLLFGALNFRKGVFETIEALRLLDPQASKTTTMIFAGWVQDPIKERFYQEIKELQSGAQVVVIDRFCPYEELYNLCYTTDVILAPYFNPDMSSGVIGYAAKFKKPVIGTGLGLLGNLIRQNGLGLTIDNVSGVSISTAMSSAIDITESSYASINTSKNFSKIITSHE